MRGAYRLAVVSAMLGVGAAMVETRAQFGYGVNEARKLFRFDLSTPSSVTEIGTVSFLPEGIDFRPGTSTLYAIDVGIFLTQVYTIDVTTAVATPVGAGFATQGTGPLGIAYDLQNSGSFGFDFNPKTLQGDNSMRIRLVGTTGVNLRLNSSTGQIAAVDTALEYNAADTNDGVPPQVDAAAYINNIPENGGTTTLYDLDFGLDILATQNPPNAGNLNTVGPMGVTVDANQNMGFDVHTDAGTLVNSAWAVLKRPDAPINGPLGAYLLYVVNLGTGQLTDGALVGPAATPYDFEGGFAIDARLVPEASTWAAMLAVGGMAVGSIYRSRRTRATT